MTIFYENKKTAERVREPEVNGYEQEGRAFSDFLLARYGDEDTYLRQIVETVYCEEGSNKYNKPAKKWLDGFTGGHSFYDYKYWREGQRDETGRGYKDPDINVIAEAHLKNGDIWGYIDDGVRDTAPSPTVGEHDGEDTKFSLKASLQWAKKQSKDKADSNDLYRLERNLKFDNRGRPVKESDRRSLDAYGVCVNWLAKFIVTPNSKTAKAALRNSFYAANHAATKK